MIHGHGGNIFRLAGQLGCNKEQILDLSSNVNPLGPPESLMEYLTDHLDAITALPQVDAAGPIQALARNWKIPESRLLASNGTTHFIYCLPKALGLQKVLVCDPTYADYADGCRLWNVELQHLLCSPDNGFRPDLDRLANLAQACDAVYICNPNNPTGRLVKAKTLTELAVSLPDTLFVIDQSYLPFVSCGQRESLSGSDLANVLILHSMSKIFRLPGLRIGLLEANDRLISQVSPFVQPWSLNSLAQLAVQWIGDHGREVENFLALSQEYCRQQRRQIEQRLDQVPGLDVFPSCTSFILCRLPEGISADQLADRLARERILIRDCGNFSGLNQRYFRLSLKDPRTNQNVCDLITGWVKTRFRRRKTT